MAVDQIRTFGRLSRDGPCFYDTGRIWSKPLKLFLVILFFWTAGPVSGHMISRLEAMTDENLGEILVIRKGKTDKKQKEEEKGDETL